MIHTQNAWWEIAEQQIRNLLEEIRVLRRENEELRTQLRGKAPDLAKVEAGRRLLAFRGGRAK